MGAQRLCGFHVFAKHSFTLKYSAVLEFLHEGQTTLWDAITLSFIKNHRDGSTQLHIIHINTRWEVRKQNWYILAMTSQPKHISEDLRRY